MKISKDGKEIDNKLVDFLCDVFEMSANEHFEKELKKEELTNESQDD